MEFPLPHLEAHSWAYGINRHLWACGRGEDVVRVRERLQTKILKFFFSKHLFFILISLSQNTIKKTN